MYLDVLILNQITQLFSNNKDEVDNCGAYLQNFLNIKMALVGDICKFIYLQKRLIQRTTLFYVMIP